MFTAARVLLPVSLSVLVVIYKYFRSGQKSKFSEGAEVPLNPTSVPSPAPSDLEREILDWIRTLDPAVLNRIRNRDPALLQEIQQFDPAVEIRNLDPSIVDEIRNLDPAFPSEFSESVDVPQNPPSVPSPEPSVVEILDWIGTLGPAVLDEIRQFDPAFLDEDRSFDPSIVDGIRKLSLKEKEDKAEEEKERETEKEKENDKERESEKSESSSGGSGGGNENGGAVEEEVVEERMRIGVTSVAPALELNFSGLPIRPAPAYLPHRSMPAPPPPPPPPPYLMNNSVTETNYHGQYAQRTQAEELPERPGQPVCFYIAQTGDCVNKSNCQYHHPKNQTAATPSCALSDRGFPLRPGQKICTEYIRSGVCSSGPTCRFDHPSLSDSFL